MIYDRPADPLYPPSWLAAACRLIAGLKGRYWALLILVYSGRAMLPFAPLPGSIGLPAGWGQAFSVAIAFLTIFWMPYLFIRAMAGEPKPGRPNLGFLWFVLVAVLIRAIRSLGVTGAHWLAMNGEQAGGGVGALPLSLLFLLFDLASAAFVTPLLSLYAGTATSRLSPLEPRWRRAVRRDGRALFCAYALVVIAVAALQTILPGVPVLHGPTLAGIITSHLHASLEAALFLVTLALALAAANSALRLPEDAPPR
ncbi:hypothetical protein [Pacificimonas flava]|uniref:Uncharacterized protein n=1 Tax=Pacificimonas flava TaxID=1234595 RepID=M2TAY4_9SPHN|nr:hypothetical protein [Pacificimonas flava]EMD83764.1 hypothetical protein C725_0736 [Pacificimonas flava]MBB5280554.1 hypothetical protein [Pacificimonas flava]